MIYEWMAKLDLATVRDIFDRISDLIGRPPDTATLLDEKSDGRSHVYKNFVKRDLISKKNWVYLSYTWSRGLADLSDFAVELAFKSRMGKRLEFHLDEAAVNDAKLSMTAALKLIAEVMLPIYGVGYSMPFYWGPAYFAQGMTSQRYAMVDKTFYGAPEYIAGRSRAFGGTYDADEDQRNLNVNIRDVFELNLISEGHLNRLIDGIRLQDWIEKNRAGTLRQVNDITWRWHVPVDRIEEVRLPLIAAGITVVKE